jgi:hypothetical protein
MRLDPFVQVDDVGFATTADELLRRKGPPVWRGRNGVGLNEFDYGRCVFRFQEGGRLEEITAEAAVVVLGTIVVPFGALSAFLRDQDSDAFERARFIVSPRFGLAFDPGDGLWVTALAAHCIGAWRAL